MRIRPQAEYAANVFRAASGVNLCVDKEVSHARQIR